MESTYLKTFYNQNKNTRKLKLHIEVEADLVLKYIDNRMRSKKQDNEVYDTILEYIALSKENLSIFDCDGFRDFLHAVKNKDIRKARELLYDFLFEE